MLTRAQGHAIRGGLVNVQDEWTSLLRCDRMMRGQQQRVLGMLGCHGRRGQEGAVPVHRGGGGRFGGSLRLWKVLRLLRLL
jgi:hypothetical protein